MIGTGYVGLVTGTCFADSGNDVTCVDIDPEEDRDAESRARSRSMNRDSPRWSSGMPTRAGCTSRPIWRHAVSQAECVFLAVGTPQGDDGAADLQYIFAAAESDRSASAATGRSLITKSTVPVGTNRRIHELLREKTGRDIDVASESGVSQGRVRDRGLHQARPRRRRRDAVRKSPSCCRSCTARFCAPNIRSWPWGRRARR